MKLFKCTNCSGAVYFENTFCGFCNKRLGYWFETESMLTLEKVKGQIFKETVSSIEYKFCQNHQFDACNWLIQANSDETFCIACNLNRTIPNIENPKHLERWQKIEIGKHRLLYSILKWKLPFKNKNEDPDLGLAFDFKADDKKDRILTGHDSGLITINIEEADDVEREMARKNMDEVYRTVLGHFRHEIGHYYWDVLIAENPVLLKKFRILFGDETYSYQKALDKHYKNGAPANWPEKYISAYSTMHPWEDWAECWAHYFHIIDTLETAFYAGLEMSPRITKTGFETNLDFQPYFQHDFSRIMNNWVTISLSLNSLNRSMGLNDLYPFVMNDAVLEKLEFIHQIIHYNLENKKGLTSL